MQKQALKFLVLSFVLFIFGCSGKITPPETFLDSKIATPMGMNNFPFGQVSVREFEEKLSKKQLDNGSYPKIEGWTNTDNIYTLHAVTNGKDFEVTFAHILSKSQGDGAYSGMSGKIDGKEYTGIQIMQFVMF